MKKLILAAVVLLGFSAATTAQTKQLPSASPAQAGKVTNATNKTATQAQKPSGPIRDAKSGKVRGVSATGQNQAAGPNNATNKPATANVRPVTTPSKQAPVNTQATKASPTNPSQAPAKGAPKK